MAKELRSNIVIGGRADPSFFALARQLEGIGEIVNQASQKVIQFGKESVEAYVSYEDAMLNAEVALRTQYNTTTELGKVMDQLNKSALQWANDSRFTTDDVANAISNAAHAGWDLQKILNGVPNAMKISLAGGMDLAQGLSYLVDITNAAGVGFDELGDMVDTWAYAANSSNTTIDEMGAAMRKMGPTMQFFRGDMAGLTTMLAVLANNGAKGTEAGTLLRNSMIRLIAPTKAAAQSMDDLNVSADDLNSIYTNEQGLAEVSQMLEDAGFSAYNSAGQLKDFIDIFAELDAATKGMTEQDRNKILSTIFPTRTITGALALLSAASNGWNGLYDSINTNASGYAGYAASTMESGLGGTLRHLESVWNVLQTRTGSELAEPVGTVAGALSGMIESVNNMNEPAFSGLVGGMKALAVSGPGILLASGGMKAINWLLKDATPLQMWTMGATAVGMLAKGIYDVSDALYEGKFGQSGADADAFRLFLQGLSEDFSGTTTQIDAYNKAMEQAIDNFTSASGNLKENMFTAMLTQKQLTAEDIRGLQKLGSDMSHALIEGIQKSYNSSMESLNLFGDGGNGFFGGIMDTLNYGYQEAIAQAESLSAQLRDAMTSAFKDGVLGADEINAIQEIIDLQNELFALQTDAQNAAARERLFRQAQTLGIDQMGEIAEMATTSRDAAMKALEDNYYNTYALLTQGGMLKIRQGALKEDGTAYTEADLRAEQDALYAGYLNSRNAESAKYDQTLMDLFSTTISESSAGKAWEALANFADQSLQNGFYDQEAYDEYTSGYGLLDRNAATRFLGNVIDLFGGLGEVASKANMYGAAGNTEMANYFARIMAMYGAANGNDTSMLSDAGIAVSGDTTELENEINAVNGTEVKANVSGDVTQLLADIDAVSGSAYVTVPVSGGGGPLQQFAEGGRATEASIFGEAGPEWAIPEEHSARTAALLDAARQASGFTWPEIIGRNTGNYTLVYSPTIVSNGETGIEAKLQADKMRLEKWFRDKKLSDDVEVYS